MKKQFIFIVLVLAGWGISSCKKEYSIENATLQGPTANFTADVNGVHWAASLTREGATIVNGLINITGISADSQEITMTLSDTSLGTYVLGPKTASLAAYGNVDSSLSDFTTSQGDSSQTGGQVTVTEIDKANQTISGTFSFKVYRTSDGQQRTITSGVFNKISYAAGASTSGPADTLTATIDNSAWTAASIQPSSFDNQLTIVGSLSSGTQSIALILPATITPGTYTMTPTGGSVTYMGIYDEVVNGSNSADPASSGTITVLSNNTSTSRIRGTFQFKTTGLAPYPSHSLTNGYFSVYYGQ